MNHNLVREDQFWQVRVELGAMGAGIHGGWFIQKITEIEPAFLETGVCSRNNQGIIV